MTYSSSERSNGRHSHYRRFAMSVSYGLLVADNLRRPRGSVLRPAAAIPDGYEPQHSERQVSGAVRVGQEVRWSATLAVPMTGDQSLLLTIERQGPTLPDSPSVDDLMLVIPPGEADAVLELLRGIIAHARQDGVLRT